MDISPRGYQLHSNFLLDGVRWTSKIENELKEGCGEGNGAGLQGYDNEAVDNASGRIECVFELSGSEGGEQIYELQR